ncbi:MAG: hypothetical protein K8U57_34160 [Planctomycetes bacterium]|nr:hypothetical protein [Planctomycetota bacterium]
MRRVLMMVIVLLSSTACTRFAGPLAVRQMDRADAPGYTIEEQEKRGRARLALPDDDRAVGPKTNIDPTGNIGG